MSSAPPTPHASDLARRIALRRAELGLSVEQLADRAGIDPGYLAYFEETPDANMNRNVNAGPTAATYHTPTVTAAGNQLVNVFLPGGARNQATGGTIRTGTEWVLRTNTNYLLRLTNRAGSAQPASLAVQWYEK